MSRAGVRMTILCEDRQQDAFVRRFLEKLGFHHREIRVPPYPKGSQSAEQWVRECFSDELRAYRSKKGENIGLIVITDADAMTVKERIKSLDDQCTQNRVLPRQPQERVVFIIPKRNIETWLAYLRGESVNETTSYGKYDQESKCQGDVNRLHEMCHKKKLEGNPPDSLIQACDEFRRVGADI